jgi:hypothetical protein
MAKEPFRIQHASIYSDGGKIGVTESATYTINGNDEDHITDEGWSASDGTLTTELDVETITPVDGKTDALIDAIEQKKYLKMQVGILDGRVHAVTMRCVSASYKSDAKTGSLKGSFKFRGGAPKRS